MNFLSGHKKETLQEHENEVKYQYEIMKQNINITNMIKQCIREDISINILEEIFDKTISYHDIGKLNPYFQEYVHSGKYKNDKNKRGHSKISCIKFINDMYEQYILEGDFSTYSKRKVKSVKSIICKFILNCSYNIWKHHNQGGIQNKLPDKLYINELIDYHRRYKECFKYIDINIENLEYFKTINDVKFENPIVSYLLFKLNYAMLVKADYLAVYKYYHKKDLNDNRIKYNCELLNNFNSNEIIANIHKYKNNKIELSEINKYRADMFLESENNLLENINEHIYFLEAPTGSGKSTIAINLALKLLNDKYNRIVYVSPLNNISEQMYYGTKDKLQPINDSDIALINSRETIITTDEYAKDYLNYQTFNYPIIMTSHVKLFNILFGRQRKDLLALDSLRNSVLILDEIQNYKNKIWINFINMFSQIAQIYNIKIVIMSATLPKMDKLLQENNKIKTINLIQNTEHYFSYFRKRVAYDYELLDKLRKNDKNSSEEVLDKIDDVIKNTNKHRILIETLSTKTCEEFYDYLKKYEDKGFLVFKILSITNLKVRQSIIRDIQEKNKDGTYKNKKIILIGTQCIEAGIDIDMNIGFKDISVLDFDEQFIGRIERNFNDTGICYFFDLDNEDYIYKDDYRIEFNLKTSKEYRKLFENKDFSTYYLNNYEWLTKYEYKEYENFMEKLNNLQYEDIDKRMTLIDNNTYSFIFTNKFEEGENIYDCKELLNEYTYIKESNIDYAEKEIKLREVRTGLNNFTYSIPTYRIKEEPIGIDKINGYYIIENGINYFDNIHNENLTNKSNLNLGAFCSSLGLII